MASLPSHSGNHAPLNPFLLGALGFCTLSLGTLLYLILSPDPVLRANAITHGQLYHIDLETKEILGRDAPPVTETVNTAPPKDASDSHESHHKPEAKTPSHSDTPHHAQKEEKKHTHTAKTAKKPPHPEKTPTHTPIHHTDDGFIRAELLEKTASGALPKISKQNLRPSQAYAASYTLPEGKTPIAILITDLGLREKTLTKAAALPAMVGIGLHPYASNPMHQAMLVHSAGHEYWLGLPMQQKDYPASDPGMRGLLTKEESADHRAKLLKSLAQLQGYVGVYSDQHEVISTERQKFSALLKETHQRGLYYMLGNRDSDAAKDALIRNHLDVSIPQQYVGRDIITPVNLSQRLTLAEQQAKQKGFYLLMIEGTPLTLKALESWIPTLKSHGFSIAPPSYIYRLKAERGHE